MHDLYLFLDQNFRGVSKNDKIRTFGSFLNDKLPFSQYIKTDGKDHKDPIANWENFKGPYILQFILKS